GIGYWAYASLNKQPAPEPPPGISAEWGTPPQITLGGPGMSAPPGVPSLIPATHPQAPTGPATSAPPLTTGPSLTPPGAVVPAPGVTLATPSDMAPLKPADPGAAPNTMSSNNPTGSANPS